MSASSNFPPPVPREQETKTASDSREEILRKSLKAEAGTRLVRVNNDRRGPVAIGTLRAG